MAKVLNLKIDGDNRGFVAAMKGIQASLHHAQKSFDEFKADMKVSTRAMEGMAVSAGEVAEKMKKAAGEIDEAGAQAGQTAREIDKLNRALKTTKGSQFTNAIGRGFKTMGQDIMRTTKLLSTFATVAGGIQLHIAKQNFLEYSDQFNQVDSIVATRSSAERVAMRKMIKEGAINMGVTEGQFADQFKATLSGGIAIDRKKTIAEGGTLTKAEVDADYMQQILNVGKISKDLGDFANIAGVNLEHASTAIVNYGLAVGKTAEEMRDPVEIKKAIAVVATTLDQGLGNLTEYSVQMNKFIKQSIDSGASVAFTMSMFARQTKLGTTAMAGFSLRAFTRALLNVDREAQAMTTKIKNQLVPKKDSEGNVTTFWAGDATQTKRAQEFLRGLDSTEEAKRRLGYIENEDGSFRKRNGEEIYDGYIQVIRDGLEAGVSAGAIISKISTNVNQAKILQDAIGIKDAKTGKYNFAGYKDMKNIMEKYASEEVMAESLAKKKEKLEAAFFINYRRAISSYNAWTTESALKMSKSMSGVANAVENMFAGKPTNMIELNEIFEANKKELKETSPILFKIVEYMQQFANYVADGGLKEDLVSIRDGFMSIVSAVSAVWGGLTAMYESPAIKGLRSFFGFFIGDGLANAIVAIGGISLTKSIIGGVAGGLGSIQWAAAGMAFGAAAQVGLGAAVLGVAIGRNMYHTYRDLFNQDEKDKAAARFSADAGQLSLTDRKDLNIQETLALDKKVLADSKEENLQISRIMDPLIGRELANKYKESGAGRMQFLKDQIGGWSTEELVKAIGLDETQGFLNSLIREEDGTSKASGFFGAFASYTGRDGDYVEGMIATAKSLQAQEDSTKTTLDLILSNYSLEETIRNKDFSGGGVTHTKPKLTTINSVLSGGVPFVAPIN